jgi:hypothetical protein
LKHRKSPVGVADVLHSEAYSAYFLYHLFAQAHVYGNARSREARCQHRDHIAARHLQVRPTSQERILRFAEARMMRHVCNKPLSVAVNTVSAVR